MGCALILSAFNCLVKMKRAHKRVLQVAVDLVLLAFVFSLSMWIRLDSWAFAANPKVWAGLIIVMPVTIVTFMRLGFYRAVLRYIAGRALLTILKGAIISGFVLWAVASVASLPIPRTVPVIYTLFTFLAIGGVRFAFRDVLSFFENRRKERVVIYGAGAAGRQVLQLLRQKSNYTPIAFFDDSVQAQGTHVGGLPVYAPAQIERLARRLGFTVVLLAMPSATRARRSDILQSLENLPLLIQTVPALDDILTGKAQLDQINDVSIEDLLGRDAVPPRKELLGANNTGKVVMVTGAGGSIGSELCRQVLQLAPKRLVLYEFSEPALYVIEQELLATIARQNLSVEISPVLACVKSARLVERSMRHFKVDTVYHAAAYKHVPLVEHNIAEGVRNNVFGTATVAQAAIAAGVKSFILISSDKSVRPTNIMGASKRMAELVCQALADAPQNFGTTISMVRFGNVLGSSGSVIPAFRAQIAAGGPISVTHPEITRFFMTIPEAAQLVLQAGAMAKGGDVFLLDMGEPVLIADLAARMARLNGLKPIILKDPQQGVAPGEIGIVFTRLRPGEKLYEELLIGNDPHPTSHPRIMAASEIRQPLDKVLAALDQLAVACDANDIDRIRKVFVDMHTAYQPSDAIVDQFWPLAVEPMQKPEAPRRLALVNG